MRLINKQYNYATNLVNAVFDKNSFNYKAAIDFGDPVQFFTIKLKIFHIYFIL